MLLELAQPGLRREGKSWQVCKKKPVKYSVGIGNNSVSDAF